MALPKQLKAWKWNKVVAVCGILLAALLTWSLVMKNDGVPEELGNVPLRRMTVVVPAASRLAFLARMDKFASDNKFAKRIRSMDPDLPQFSLDLWREGLGIFGANVLAEQEFDFGVHVNKTHPVSSETVDKLVEALSAAAMAIPGVSVSMKPN